MSYTIKDRDGNVLDKPSTRLYAVWALQAHNVSTTAAVRMLDCADGQRPAEDFGQSVTVERN
jgi:hypothetical protein